ncbi:alpha/beta hydrolase [Calidifontibacillus oryziterrae]|uniref:alpha/beta hydrolase n=1 Tax=Calidifontibacillus oryziterrae TaxID=1191699 RepID=UPI00030A4D58|nr:alpha/beta hydrolase [Calidifontibacillus oryziterrae]
MREENRWLTMSDGEEIYIKSWFEDDIIPKAIVQLSHGMAEHIERYEAFANELVENHIFVYGNDHRGHGKTGEKQGLLGFFAEKNGFERAVEDLNEVNQFIKDKHPDIPIFLLGHSMGSFLVRRYIQRFQDNVNGAIISGTAGNPGFLGKIGKQIAKAQIRKLGKKEKSPLLNKMTFGNYNKKIANVETEFDWLSRDRNEVKKYNDDPLCGFIPTAGFFYDLLTGLEIIHQDNEVKNINKQLPILFFSGEHDPVGNHTKGVVEVIKQYKNHGIQHIEYIFYKEGRHEMLNEVNRVEVTGHIINWIEKQLR